MSRPSNWEFIPRSDFATPGFSAETIRSLHGAWKTLGKKIAGWRNEAKPAHGTLDPPSELPEGMVPEIDLEAAAAALAERLATERPQARAVPGLRVVTGPPGSRVPEIVSAVARANDWPEVEAPHRRALHADRGEFGKALEALDRPANQPAVIGRLEAWFLRREIALPAIRALVQLLSKRSAPTLIGCDSWTWAYLDRAIGIEGALGEPLVLAPFDGAKLDAWLGEPFRSTELVCMRAGSRDEIFSPRLERNHLEDNGSEASKNFHPLLDELASAARGNPGVARAMWQRSLREGDLEGGKNERTAAEQDRSWWAVAPDEAEVTLPGDTDDIHRFVLHASLLHGGLEADLLVEGLPFPNHQVVQGLTRLTAAGVLVESQGRLAVAESAYVAVRRNLSTRGFLVDDL